jgi:hypothetical protein
MTTYSAVLPGFTTAATANMRDFMNSFVTLLTNAGFTQSADTGQLVIASSPAYVSTSTTSYGYQIWYLDDTQHATYPIYIKFNFWMGTTSSLGYQWVVGHATDGAGNITGYKFPAAGYYSGSTNTIAQQAGASNSSRAVSLDGYGALYHAPPTSATFGYGHIFIISREWDDSTGAIKTGGNYTITHNQGTTSYGLVQVSINRANSTYVEWASSSTLQGYGGCLVPGILTNSPATASQNAGTTDIFKHWHSYPTYTPSGGSCTYQIAEITQMTTFSTQILTGGSARTWLATGNPRWAVGSAGTNHALALLWE